MSPAIDLGNGKTVSATVAGSHVQLLLVRGFMQFSERLTPAQADQIAGLLTLYAQAARANLQPQGRG